MANTGYASGSPRFWTREDHANYRRHRERNQVRRGLSDLQKEKLFEYHERIAYGADFRERVWCFVCNNSLDMSDDYAGYIRSI